ncbi:MAG: methyltransferase [Balneolales bacterium]|nr:methyltransferase [Balneolales bacterium]
MTLELIDYIFDHTGVDLKINPLPASELKALEIVADGDVNLLSCYLKRRISGEPLAYILGFIDLDGLRIPVDKRAYITDPEAIYLVQHLKEVLGKLPSQKVLEVGTGCGSLSFYLEHHCPEHQYWAVDIDSNPIDLARDTAQKRDSSIHFVVSDYFMGLPAEYTPDLIFADPPWGNESSIYDDDRPASHYHSMPGISVWPFKSITGIHEQIVDAILLKGWGCPVFMNFGMLDADSIWAAIHRAPHAELIQAAKNVTLAKLTF